MVNKASECWRNLITLNHLGTLVFTNSSDFNETLDRMDSQGMLYVKEKEQRYTETKVL
jgi:hypothetical protein